jgi:DNA-binding NtrC family response regulator
MSRGNHDDKTLEELPGLDGRPAVHDDVHVLLECDRPLAGSTRHCIDDVDCVLFRRGPVRRFTREAVAGVRTLTLEVPDRHMSSVHGGLRRFAGQWLFEDTGSRNGSYLGGRRISGAALVDGHVLQLGHTLFLFRSTEVTKRSGEAQADREPERGPPGEVVTLSHSLEIGMDQALEAARAGTRVLFVGEAGSGKEALARDLHARVGGSGTFVCVRCAELGERAGDALESALAGAAGGAVFLDRVDTLGRDGERALVLALESLPRRRTPRVLGSIPSNEGRPTSVRADVLASLFPTWIAVPPLRERVEDLGLLVSQLLAGARDAPSLHIEPTMGQSLALHDWPRNLPELEDCVRTSLANASDRRLSWSPSEETDPAGTAKRDPPPPRPRLDSANHRLATEGEADEDFAREVRRALKCNLSPHLLQRNGLLETAMVREATQDAAAASVTAPALREIVLAAIDSLRQSSARGAKQAGVLQLTFVEPAATQQEAADRLGMAFGTYRRHVTAGLVALTEILWFREQTARRHRGGAEAGRGDGPAGHLRSG